MFSWGLFLSLYGMTCTFLTGNKWKFAPLLAFLGQFIWMYYAINIVHDTGLLIGVLFYSLIYARNAYKWLK